MIDWTKTRCWLMVAWALLRGKSVMYKLSVTPDEVRLLEPCGAAVTACEFNRIGFDYSKNVFTKQAEAAITWFFEETAAGGGADVP